MMIGSVIVFSLLLSLCCLLLFEVGTSFIIQQPPSSLLSIQRQEYYYPSSSYQKRSNNKHTIFDQFITSNVVIPLNAHKRKKVNNNDSNSGSSGGGFGGGGSMMTTTTTTKTKTTTKTTTNNNKRKKTKNDNNKRNNQSSSTLMINKQQQQVTTETTTTTKANNANNNNNNNDSKQQLLPIKTTKTTVFRKDYSQPSYWITNINLDFNIINDNNVTITSIMTVVPNNNNNKNNKCITENDNNNNNNNINDSSSLDDLILDGDASIIKLKRISVMKHTNGDSDSDDDEEDNDGSSSSSSSYFLDENHHQQQQQQQHDLIENKDYILTSDALRIKKDSLMYFCSMITDDDGNDDDNNNNNNKRIYIRTVVEISNNLSSDKQQQQKSSSSSSLSGLYRRDNMFVTHCEPTGFRRITYFLDRPDNTAIFHVRIEGSKNKYPLLLSNGNCIESGDLINNNNNNNNNSNNKDDDGGDDNNNNNSQQQQRHYAIFKDPYPKPCYIFGLIAAGNLANLQDTHITRSGKVVQLRIYTSEGQSISNRLQFALQVLKRSMEWDEQTYGLEYDLNTYSIIAAQHFVLGAMENKGLNIFQTSLIATDPQCTTDVTYDLVEKTIAHEYFHNWSGNRVTISNWFEFTLKEGLTVYRDQEYMADVGLRTITRIESIKILREKQFREDASHDQRHPIRPEQADAIREHTLDALASSTTYHKGAEVCRMYKSILGKEGFRNGLRLYMSRNDGKGATCDDFRNVMADANNVNLDQFALWYSTAGTPRIDYKYSYDEMLQTFSLTLTQSLGHSDDDDDDDVLLHIPVAVGLLDKSTGEEVVKTKTLSLKERTQTFEFRNLENDVVPSILRDFSAPVILQNTNANDEGKEYEALTFLATYDTDGFNRWEAMQQLYSKCIFRIMRNSDSSNNDELDISNIELDEGVLKAFKNTLNDPKIDPATKSYLLNLPTEAILSRQLEMENPIGVHKARRELGKRIRDEFQIEIQTLYDEMTDLMILKDGEEVPTDTMSRAKRSLRNVLLDFLCFVDEGDDNQQTAASNLAMNHLDNAACLTDRLAAFRNLSSMAGVSSHARDVATQKFYEFAKETNDPVVMHKWFQTQALSHLPDVLDRVKALTQHPDFKATNAGRFRSLITSFTMNAKAFHCEKGEGYKFIGSVITQMDRVAPPLAIELANKLGPWKRHGPSRGSKMKAELKRIASAKNISRGLAITVQRALSA